jgi:SulP family sulfate permease
VFDFGGPLSFGAAADLGHHVRERALKNGTQALILDFSRVPFMDVSAARAVETIACDARLSGKQIFCSGIREEVERVLSGLNADHCIPSGRKFDRRIDALRAAVAWRADTQTEPAVAGAAALARS